MGLELDGFGASGGGVVDHATRLVHIALVVDPDLGHDIGSVIGADDVYFRSRFQVKQHCSFGVPSTYPESVVRACQRMHGHFLGREKVGPDLFFDSETAALQPQCEVASVHAHVVTLSVEPLEVGRVGVWILKGLFCAGVPRHRNNGYAVVGEQTRISAIAVRSSGTCSST